MKACFLRAPAKVESNPLEFGDVPRPEPRPGEVSIRVEVCGVCRTDLHVVEKRKTIYEINPIISISGVRSFISFSA